MLFEANTLKVLIDLILILFILSQNYEEGGINTNSVSTVSFLEKIIWVLVIMKFIFLALEIKIGNV